ncbi:rod shape-determining protein MreC [Legionella birminghamensis]|uniref:Cell shape-determining protein MreC n=1 Tax=Legionella birminghamensis TaxID=28083 RepID=A0A378IB64_9GAMM|nr:rod shape-determining protein MreC [Legionella birminghamensis]KTC76093.1 rod shape-determining protein MreC [Legionella birminghamensis]STX32283.1 rod shape-determining protein MreC [Legionella birminghamensis]
MAVISSQPNNSKSRLFTKGRHNTSGFVFAVALSIGLMFSDYHYNYLGSVRNGFSFLVSPLQYAVDYPVRIIGWIQSLVGSKTALIDENIQLRYQQTLLEAELQKLMAIKEENSQLRELLLTSSKAQMRAMAAQILAVDTTTARQFVVLNKGKRDGAYVGQPVLDAKGVMGQIIDVGYMTSTVLLISDSKSAVPVRNTRTGERAILVGSNNLGQLSLINLPRTSNITKGDLLVTSGLGRLYPEGYPVGRVESVQSIPGDAFIKVNVSPVALLNRNRLVLLIWPDKEQAELTRQINERIKAAGAGS